MVTIKTKKMTSGKWSCYTTYKGIDKAFEGNDITVVSQMMDWLNSLGNKPELYWEDPVIYKPEEKIPEPPIQFQRNRIDHLN